MLLAVIERDIFLGLEQAQLADPLGRDTAGGEVGDASAAELEAHIADVHLPGKDGYSGCADFFEFGLADQVQHYIQIVNHQVEHDIDVEASRAEQIEPV